MTREDNQNRNREGETQRKVTLVEDGSVQKMAVYGWGVWSQILLADCIVETAFVLVEGVGEGWVGEEQGRLIFFKLSHIRNAIIYQSRLNSGIFGSGHKTVEKVVN